MLELKLYRHKYNKDIFLARNWHIVGGSYKTDFYYATKDIVTAIKDAQRDRFLEWAKAFKDGVMCAKIIDTKEIEIDGYCGSIRKELQLPVKDFELVVLKEK